MVSHTTLKGVEEPRVHSRSIGPAGMSTYTSLHFHIVFATRGRVPCLVGEWRHRLFEYMGGTVKGLSAFPEGLGGWNDHVHLLIGLKATQNVSDIVREIKKASTAWLRGEIGLRGFAWQEGYGAFTVGYRERDIIKGYIADQEEHHRKRTFREELETFYAEAGIEYDPKYLV